MMLLKLVEKTYCKEFTVEVISLSGMDSVGERLAGLGVNVICLNMQQGPSSAIALFKLVKYLRNSKAELIHSWMYHANFLTGLATLLFFKKPLIWSVHHEATGLTQCSLKTYLISSCCTLLSYLKVKKIIYCSTTAKNNHERFGYCKQKSVVIDNGIDLSLFRPNQSSRTLIRQELGVAEDTLIIGLIARFDPMKDHATFIHAAQLFLAEFPETLFLLCGDGIDASNQALKKLIVATNKQTSFCLLGKRDDVPRITATLDIATSSSISESFSLTIGEAMATGIPCVATASGGPEKLLGNCGLIVPIRSPQALCDAWRKMLNMHNCEKTNLINAARQRIEKSFSLEAMVQSYLRLYNENVNS